MEKLVKNRTALAAAVFGCLFVLSLIPILVVSFYSNPAADDYTYMDMMKAAVESGSLVEIVKASMDYVIWCYFGWQGTFSAIFLFGIQPVVFSPDLNWISTFLFLGSLVGATLFFLYMILVRWQKQPVSRMLILSFGVLTLQIQFIPNIPEGFFWFTGASLYTLFYSLSLLLWGLVACILLAPSRRRRLLLTVAALPMAFFVGGGNYSTGLFGCCMFALLLLCLAVRKHPAAGHILAVALSFYAAFAIVVLAPGNGVRAEYFATPNPFRAIADSLIQGFALAEEWTSFGVLAVLLGMYPVILRAARESTLSFRFPMLAVAVAFGLYACQLTPPIYAMGHSGEGRLMDLYYLSYVMLLLFVVYYMTGWALKRYPSAGLAEGVCAFYRRNLLPLALTCLILFAGTCLGRGVTAVTTPACVHYFRNGTVQEHDRIIRQQREEASQTQGDYVITVATPPISIFQTDALSADPNGWANEAFASYFGCRSVVYDPS